MRRAPPCLVGRFFYFSSTEIPFFRAPTRWALRQGDYKSEEKKQMSALQKPEVIRAISDALVNLGIFATKRELDVAFADLQNRAFSRTATGENDFSITRFVRALRRNRAR